MLDSARNNMPFFGHVGSFVCLDKIAFDWTNCLVSYKNNTKNKCKNGTRTSQQG